MQFQYISDVHLEFHDLKVIKKIKRCAPYLLVAGDLCSPYDDKIVDFFDHCSAIFDKIFYIAGNHEYYSMDRTPMEVVEEQLRLVVSKYDNVIYLSNEAYHLNDDVVLLGTILWSVIDEQRKYEIKGIMNDYLLIYSSPFKNVTVDDISAMAKENINWLTDEISKNKDKKVVVMTHHLPSYSLISHKYRTSPANSAYANNLDHLISDPVVAWIFGHSHCADETVINNVKVMANCKGYPGEKIKHFKHNKVFTIE